MPMTTDIRLEPERLLRQALAASLPADTVGTTDEARFARAATAAIGAGLLVPMADGATLRFTPTASCPHGLRVELTDIKRAAGEHRNLSIALAAAMVLKIYREAEPGIHPEIETLRHLSGIGFRSTPPLLGWIEHIDRDGRSTTLSVLEGYVAHDSDAATIAIDTLGRDLEARLRHRAGETAPAAEAGESFVLIAALIGRRIGELHAALALPSSDPAFAPEPVIAADMAREFAAATEVAEEAFAALGSVSRASPEAAAAAALHGRRPECLALLRRLAVAPGGAMRMRVHGDLHLGQILVAKGDAAIVDFEGEPGRSIDRRRLKQTPLRDVAAMLRSLAYAGEIARQGLADRFGEVPPEATELTAAWRSSCEAAFLKAYRRAAEGTGAWVKAAPERRCLLRFHLLARALFEIGFEAVHHPGWIGIPVRGVLEVLDGRP